MNTLCFKFLIPLLLGGTILASFGSWLSYESTTQQLKKQLLKRAHTLGVAIDEATLISNSPVEIRFAVENIIKEKNGIYGITVVT